MRLVDFYIDPILKVRELAPALNETDSDCEAVKALFTDLIIQAQTSAVKSGYSQSTAEAATFPIVAFVDEILMTSTWTKRLDWQRNSLQREFFETSNAGAEFYDRLNQLNRQGDDRSVREVYLLCLGLGFKGQYYAAKDRPKIEEARVFNLELLLPQDANRVFEKTTLFSDAYHEGQQLHAVRKSRMNLTPLFTITPVVLVVGTVLFYATQIGSGLNQIMDLVK